MKDNKKLTEIQQNVVKYSGTIHKNIKAFLEYRRGKTGIPARRMIEEALMDKYKGEFDAYMKLK